MHLSTKIVANAIVTIEIRISEPRYSGFFVNSQEISNSAMIPPVNPPPAAPIALLVPLFFTLTLALQTWQVMELRFVRKKILRY